MQRHNFTQLTDLALERLGGRAVLANDEFFAAKENLLKQEEAVYISDKYTDRGKWMDGWETRRRRQPGHDWCIIKLAVPGTIRRVDVDTTHFKGNHPQACSIDGAEGDPATDVLTAAALRWTEILPKAPLRPHSRNLFAVNVERRFSSVRLNIFPDGGVARFRVYGEARPDWQQRMAAAEAAGRQVDLAAAVNGGLIIDCSDIFFSSPRNLLMPDGAVDVSDGWETRRRRGPGHDWCIIKLGCRGLLESIEVDTSHFKGNYPDRCSLDVADIDNTHASASSDTGTSVDATSSTDEHRDPLTAAIRWQEVLPETKLQADKLQRFPVNSDDAGACTHVRFNIYPDGGVSRLRLYGRPVDS
ncbi:MAG: allantoicase [Acidobacteriota bacterium]